LFLKKYADIKEGYDRKAEGSVCGTQIKEALITHRKNVLIQLKE
jgi:hypothetical protein